MAATHPRCCSRRFNFKEPSLYFKSPTLHTQDIHWIDNEARGPGDPQLASGGPAHPSRAHLRSRSAARFRPHAMQTILQF
jgi:hypothetical protein